MGTTHSDADAALVAALTDLIAASDLGPVAAIKVTDLMVQVSIDPDLPAKASVLRRWVDHLDHLGRVDMTSHRRPGSAIMRLNIRGSVNEFPLVVHTIYVEHAEDDEIELIADEINRSSPADLVDALIVVSAEPPR